MGKHLTLDERQEIQMGLKENKPFSLIAKTLGKSCSTISREVRNHLIVVRKGAYGRSFNECKNRFNCHQTGICEDKPDCVTKHCRNCSRCMSVCKDFKKEQCPKLLTAPYVCNGCSNRNRCTLEKHMYDANAAEKEYKEVLVESREGFNLTEAELSAIDEIASPMIKKGHSIYHLCHHFKDSITCSESTMYRLLNHGLLSSGRIDLPRAVRFKPRKGKKTGIKVDKQCRNGRTYEDFNKFVEEHPGMPIAEMDSVEGIKGGKVLLTIILTNCNFMLAFIRDRNTSQSVIDIFNKLYELLPAETYENMFGVLLGDNGSEFSNPKAIEFCSVDGNLKERSKVFYCHPSAPNEKGKVENNHEMIRRIVPKGKPFDSYTQADIDKMMSHINSYGRPQYNGVSPTELFIKLYGADVLHLLGQELISSTEIVLTPKLLKK